MTFFAEKHPAVNNIAHLITVDSLNHGDLLNDCHKKVIKAG